MSQKQDEFYADVDNDGVADGLDVFRQDKNKDGRPDIIEGYLKNLEFKFFMTWLLTALGVLGVTLLADLLGKLLGFHS